MTRNRALKHVIRTRAAKTGERYTTARRHVLRETGHTPAASAGEEEAAPAPPTPAPAPAPTATSKGTVSNAKVLEKTGHDLSHWFGVLDRFGGVEKGHSAIARHLSEAHAVDGWYAQSITVAYERARGARAINQRSDGVYEVSVSKVLAGDTTAVVTAFSDARIRKQWAVNVDADLASALSAALTGPSFKGFVVRPDGQARFRYKWGDTTVQCYVIPKAAGKVSVVVTQMKLASADAVDKQRARWKAALTALADSLAG